MNDIGQTVAFLIQTNYYSHFGTDNNLIIDIIGISKLLIVKFNLGLLNLCSQLIYHLSLVCRAVLNPRAIPFFHVREKNLKPECSMIGQYICISG